VVGFFALALAGATCFAQNPEAPKEPPKFYKLEFVVKELDAGKVVNARSYSMTASTGTQRSVTHTGSKVPVPTSPPTAPESPGSHPYAVSIPQYTIINVGVNIDCSSLMEVKSKLSLAIKADISSIAQESTTNPSQPIIRQNVWESTVVVPIKKPSVIFSSDDTATKRQMQLELTATPIE
jgi:hypothetical protein